MRDITKTFPGVKALQNVNLDVREGEIHAIVGENGAGKSTLMKVLSGVYPHGSYDGQIVFEGKECQFKGIHDSERLGIVIIHQELALVPLLSITENIFLGNERARFGVIDWEANEKRTRELLKKVGLNEDPKTLITNLGVRQAAAGGNRQGAEQGSQTPDPRRADGEPVRKGQRGAARPADRIPRPGHHLHPDFAQAQRSEQSRRPHHHHPRRPDHRDAEQERHHRGPDHHLDGGPLARGSLPAARSPKIGEVVFEVKNWSVYHPLHADRQVIKGIDINVRAGEVVGIAGLMGSGRTEFAMSVFGRSYGRKITGDVILNGKKVDVSTVGKAVDNGIAYATEDRKTYGLNLIDHIKHNTTLAHLVGVSRFGVIDDMKELDVANDYRQKTNIRSSSVYQKTGNLSGGNQQKVVLSKWLFANPDVLILDEPTRGIDVGAKYEIYTIIAQLAAEGKGIIVISSEMPELLGITDRIYVMNEGRIVGEMAASDASQEKIMRAIVRAEGKAS